jgi:hypothetical protein
VAETGLSATTYTAKVLSSPDSPAVPVRVRATGWASGSAAIDTRPLMVQLGGAFRVLRDRGQRVHSVHMAVGHGEAAAADSPPHLGFAYLDAAGTLLTVEEKDMRVRRSKSPSQQNCQWPAEQLARCCEETAWRQPIRPNAPCLPQMCGEVDAFGGEGWVFPAQPAHCVKRLLDELPDLLQRPYKLHVPGKHVQLSCAQAE